MSGLLWLLLSLAVLALGPVLAALLERTSTLRALLDGFVLVMVGGLCLFFLLPDAYRIIGGFAFPVAGLGLLIPLVSERSLHRHQRGASRTFMAVALCGLLLHSALDGAGLRVGDGHGHAHGQAVAPEAHDHAGAEAAGGDAEHTEAEEPGRLEIALAIIVHRIPVGLLVWAAVPPLLGRGWALLALGSLMLATTGGYALGGPLERLATGTPAGLIQGLLAGGLLHVVLDHGPGEALEATRLRTAAAAGGALLAAVLFMVLPLESVPGIGQAWDTGLELFYESSPAVLLGFLGAGLLSLVPTQTLARLMTGKTAFSSAARGVIFGLPIPICSCGVVPIYRGLMQKGVPPAAAIAFLVATPELGVDAVLISIPLLGIELTLVRLVAALLVALVAGLAVAAIARGEPAPAPGGACGVLEDPPEPGGKLRRALRHGFGESLDDLGPWILAGIVAAAFLQPVLDPDWLQSLPPAAEVPLFTALAAPIYVCASAATPVAAVLLLKGVTAGAVIAFLITGPATNVTTYGALRTAHSRRSTLLIIATVLGVSLLLGLVVNMLSLAGGGPPPALEHAPGPIQQVTAAGFALLLLLSFVRQGPRGFLRRLGLVHEHGHGREDDHEHEREREHASEPADAPCCGPAPTAASAAADPCCGSEPGTPGPR